MSFQIRTLHHDVQTNNNNHNTLQTVVTDNSDDIAVLQTDVIDNSDDITTLQTDVKDNSDDIITLQTDVKDNSDDIITLQTDVTALQVIKPAIIMRQTIPQIVPNAGNSYSILYDVTLLNRDPVAITYSAGDFTINSTGVYLVNAEVFYGAGNAGFRSLLITSTGTPAFRWGYVADEIVAGKSIRMTTSAVIPVTSGDILSMIVRHTNGADLTIGAPTFDAMEVSIIQLG